MRTLVAVVFFALAPATALAQSPDVLTPKKVVLDFEGELIAGNTKSPDAAFIAAKKKLKHPNLIQIRTSFSDRILGSMKKIAR